MKDEEFKSSLKWLLFLVLMNMLVCRAVILIPLDGIAEKTVMLLMLTFANICLAKYNITKPVLHRIAIACTIGAVVGSIFLSITHSPLPATDNAIPANMAEMSQEKNG